MQTQKQNWGPELTEYLKLSAKTVRGDEAGRKKAIAAQEKVPPDEWKQYLRHERRKFFTPQNAQHDKTKKFPSPSGRYVLETCPYKTSDGCWNYTRGSIRMDNGALLLNVYRNYSHFWHAWVEHANGREYLFCGEDYQGLTMIDLQQVEDHFRRVGGGISDDVDVPGRWDFLPNSAKQGFGWCTVDMYPSPDGTIIVAEGCFWGAPYDLRFYDFSEPEKGLPLPLIDSVDAEERIQGWVDNDTFVFTREIEDDDEEDRVVEELGLSDDEWDELYQKDPERLGYQLITYKWKREEVPLVQELREALDQHNEQWLDLSNRKDEAESKIEECAGIKKLITKYRTQKRLAEDDLKDILKARKEHRKESERLWGVRKLIQEGDLGHSRWGYHPCKYEHYRKLKFLNHKLMQARIKHAAAVRYWRKDPPNRVHKHYERNEKGWRIGHTTSPMKEPEICQVFSRQEGNHWDGHQKKRADLEKGIIIRGDDLEHWLFWTIDPGVEQDYWNACMPVEKPSDLRPLKLGKDVVNALVAQFPDNPWANEPA